VVNPPCSGADQRQHQENHPHQETTHNLTAFQPLSEDDN
jgi:hypothetical protein